MKAIEVKNLTKRFKEKTAVDGISFSVEEGELFALLGVNGAGKTTTIRMLSCLSKPDSGELFVRGNNCVTESAKVKRVIGISPQETSVSENLTVEENLSFIADIYGLDAAEKERRITEIIERFRLDEVKGKKAKLLSGGWQRKLSIAMALISEPEVLFLDEPTLGLDVLARRELWKEIERLKGKVTIILTTHYMEEAEQLSDRIGIMVNGRIVETGTLEQLENAVGKKGLENVFVYVAENAEGGVQ